jgi:DNA-binding response OmpR family regulator
VNLTPTERRLLALLSDGCPHRREELLACLYDDYSPSVLTLNVHLCNLRKKLAVDERVVVRKTAHYLLETAGSAS